MKTWIFDRYLFLCFACLVALAGCPSDPGGSQQTVTEPTRTVVASNYPLQFMIEKLAGGQLSVVSPGGINDPRTWSPSDEVIGKIQSADLIFMHGADYEQWLNYISLDESKVVEAARSLNEQFIEVKGEVHKHGPKGKEHAHDGLANYFWLSPKLAIGEIEKIAGSLTETYPDLTEEIKKNKKELIEGLNNLQVQLGKLKNEEITAFASDPRYAYLLRELGWNHVYFHWTNHGKEELSKNAWKKFEAKLADKRPDWMIFPFEPSKELREKLEGHKIKIVVMDSVESEKTSGDYLKRMNALLDQIAKLKSM